MRVVDWGDAVSGRAAMPERSAATIGVFDGLHLGHRALVERVVAKAPGLAPVVVTFRDNPKRVTRPHRFSGCLFTLEQKLSALEDAGAEVCVLIDFSGNFSKLAGSEFVSALGSIGVRSFVIGSDFKCGHRLSTDAEGLMAVAASFGADTEIVGPITLDGEPVSSSRIRSAIANGRTDLALAMLGRPYTLDLRRLEIEYERGSAAFSLKGSGLVEPAPGRYEATEICVAGSGAVEATLRRDGTVLWARTALCADREPAFLAFGSRIA